jgi:hypothetical protein
MGLLSVFIPGKMFILCGQENPKNHWARIADIFIISLGYFYINAAQNGVYSFYHASNFARLSGFLGLTIFKICKPKIILFGIINTLGATWTLLVLDKFRLKAYYYQYSL